LSILYNAWKMGSRKGLGIGVKTREKEKVDNSLSMEKVPKEEGQKEQMGKGNEKKNWGME